MLLIFIGSTDVLSAVHTGGFILPLLKFLGFVDNPKNMEHLHAIIRKCGHITEYAILASLLFRALTIVSQESSEKQFKVKIAIAFLLSAFYAMSDEFHQSFIPSRTASLIDVSIDCFGAFLALLIIGVGITLRVRSRA
ncbi:MAG: putative rane protein [Bacteriovoracaceae bacterium]|nr:putative rane protein [Bacteriovoracaceae bacterium]